MCRASFADCIKQLFEDVDMAIKYLPTDYGDITNESQIPASLKDLGLTVAQYNKAFGSHVWCRMSGRIASAIRAQAALLAASPAFSTGSGVTWVDAANYAAQVLDANSGVAGIAADGHKWYTAEVVGNAADNNRNHAEIIWRGGYGENCDVETDNFLPLSMVKDA